MARFFAFITSYWAAPEQQQDRGATMVEYGLIVASIAVVVAVAASALGDRLVALFGGLI